MMEIDFSSAVPIYQQIRDQVILELAKGHLREGDELPSVRSMSDEIAVNMMTVAKAYQMLKDEGIVESDRRRGTKIAENITHDEKRVEKIEEKFTLLLAESYVHGMEKEEVETMITRILEKFEQERGEG